MKNKEQHTAAPSQPAKKEPGAPKSAFATLLKRRKKEEIQASTSMRYWQKKHACAAL